MNAAPNTGAMIRQKTVLRWIQLSRFRRDYELRDGGGAVLGTMNFPGLIGSTGAAAFGDIQWTFRKQGIWRPKTFAVRQGESAPDLTFVQAPLGWSGRGEVILNDGRRFKWKSASMIVGQVFELRDAGGRLVLSSHKPWLEQARDTDRLFTEMKTHGTFEMDPVLYLLGFCAL